MSGSLHQWFKGSKSKGGKPGWVQSDGSPCANEPGETKTPKCFSSARLAALKSKGKKGESLIRSAVARKRKEDPNQQQKSGSSKPTNVSTFAKGKKSKDYVKPEPGLKEAMKLNEAQKDNPEKGSGKKDACYSKVKSRFKVWPSAYGSGALVKCRRVGADNWGNTKESVEDNEKLLSGKKYCTLCQKHETRQECSYGPQMWDKYSIATVHPGNFMEESDHEYSMARSELKTAIDAIKRMQKRFKGEGNIEAWVQSKITKASDYLDTAADYLDSEESDVNESCWSGYKQVGMKKKGNKKVPNCVPAQKTFEDFMIEASPSWQRKEGKNPEGGLNKKGIDSYRKEHPGSHLSLAVTTKPSKLKPGSKSANRRKSFCARSGGQMKDFPKAAKDPNSRLRLARKKWNC